MIAAEMKTNAAVVRIHDECFVREPRGYIAQVNQIVTDSYKRRMRMMPAVTNSEVKSR